MWRVSFKAVVFWEPASSCAHTGLGTTVPAHDGFQAHRYDAVRVAPGRVYVLSSGPPERNFVKFLALLHDATAPRAPEPTWFGVVPH